MKKNLDPQTKAERKKERGKKWRASEIGKKYHREYTKKYRKDHPQKTKEWKKNEKEKAGNCCLVCGKLIEAKAKYCNHCARLGERSPRWRGGIRHAARGYVLVLMPNHPGADGKGYIQEHRLIMEEYLGRILLHSEIVHHINGITNDNRIENLMLFPSPGEHQRHHLKLR